MIPSGNFVSEHFGFVTWKDPTIGPRRISKVKGLYRHMYALQAKRDMWAPIESIEDLSNVIEGLQSAARRIMHPSILSGDDLAALRGQIKHVCIEHGVRARIGTLTEAVKARLEGYVQMIRRRATSSTVEVPPLNQ